MAYSDQNNTNFPLSLKQNTEEYAKKYKKDEFLKFHQYIVYHYLIDNVKARGLLIYYQMGQGKSILAAAMSEYYRQHDPQRKIMILLAKSLQANFVGNIKKYMSAEGVDEEKQETLISENYKFVSLNASNMFMQVIRTEKTKDEEMYERRMGSFAETLKKNNLENSLLIIDEAHNLFNAIANGSKNALSIYDLIMRTKNIKLLFLTGTPIVNEPFELVPCFNMLKGYMEDKTTLFGESSEDFNSFFVGTDGIKNAKKFKNRIVGLLSYFGDIYMPKNNKDFPKQHPLKVELIPMSAEQYSKYADARDSEREEATKGFSVSAGRFRSTTGAHSSYRVKSRQISNYAIPEYALGPIEGKKARKKFVETIKDKDLENLSKYSPKFKKMLENIKKHKNSLGLIYSNFVKGEGIAIFERVLKLNKYTNWLDSNAVKGAFEEFGISGGADKSKKVYAVITGDISVEDRENIVKEFNKPENKHGELISLLLISGTGAEGLDLKNVQHVHIMEPFWNYARIGQIIARAVRYKSHINLPAKEQEVYPYIYLSTYPKGIPKINIVDKFTTDVNLYIASIKNKKIIDKFLNSIIEASIDCHVHKKENCVLCAPTNKQLYYSDLSKDITLPSPCQPFEAGKVKVKEVAVDDTKYYYSITKEEGTANKSIEIYEYDENLKGYISMSQSNPIYPDLIEKISKLEKLI